MKLRNSSGARIAWEGRETPNIPLSYFFPQFLLLSTSRSAALAAPSQIPVHPPWENQKRFWLFSPSSNPPVLSALLWSLNQSTEKEMRWIPAKPSSLWCATASGGGSLCQLFICASWGCFLKVVFAFQCFKANIDHCAIQVCSMV